MKTYDAYCQACGNKYKNTELRMRWDGKRVCSADWETRHPQDLLKVPRHEKSLPWTSPDPGDVFTSVSYNSLVAPANITVGASPFDWQNTGARVTIVSINGGVVSSVVKAGVTLSTSTDCYITLNAGELITVTYTSIPTMTFKRF